MYPASPARCCGPLQVAKPESTRANPAQLSKVQLGKSKEQESDAAARRS